MTDQSLWVRGTKTRGAANGLPQLWKVTVSSYGPAGLLLKMDGEQFPNVQAYIAAAVGGLAAASFTQKSAWVIAASVGGFGLLFGLHYLHSVRLFRHVTQTVARGDVYELPLRE